MSDKSTVRFAEANLLGRRTRPRGEYQEMLHWNYHIGQKSGPALDCPYCPRKPEVA